MLIMPIQVTFSSFSASVIRMSDCSLESGDLQVLLKVYASQIVTKIIYAETEAVNMLKNEKQKNVMIFAISITLD